MNLALPLLPVALLLVACLLAGDRCTTRRNEAERRRLHALFVRFVDANLASRPDEADIDRFLAGTAGVGALSGCCDTLPVLRVELHEQALRLSRLERALAEGWGGAGLHPELLAGRAERRAWLERIRLTLDARFERRAPRSVERVARLIRA